MDAIILLNRNTIQKVVVTDGSTYAGAKALLAILHEHGLEHDIEPDDAEDTDSYIAAVLFEAENAMGEPWRVRWIEDVTTIM
jgi:hypothetical protein